MAGANILRHSLSPNETLLTVKIQTSGIVNCCNFQLVSEERVFTSTGHSNPFKSTSSCFRALWLGSILKHSLNPNEALLTVKINYFMLQGVVAGDSVRTQSVGLNRAL